MSNWKHAYGWSGHILIPNGYDDGNPEINVLAISVKTFDAIVEAHENCKMDYRIKSRQLGVTSIGEILFMATGSCFSEGFEYYGKMFDEAELRCSHGSSITDDDASYLSAMKEIYGLELPPCRLMIGCASEH